MLRYPRPASFFLATIAVLMLALCQSAFGITRVFVQNNTELTFSVSAVQSGASLSPAHWQQTASQIIMGQRKEVLWFNRDDGMTSGEDFQFATSLSSGGNTIRLIQAVKGKTINSKMWQMVQLNSESSEWYDDRDNHWQMMRIDGAPVHVLFRAFFTGTDDNIEYIITKQPVVPPQQNNSLSILAYNIYMRTGPFYNGQTIRSGILAKELGRAWDAIVFSEAFDDDVRKNLQTKLSAQFPYATRILGSERGIEEDGGVIILSRWPIVAQDQRLFGDVCNGTDCLADKGVLYAQIDKQGTMFHLFASHTNADNSVSDVASREQQFSIIRKFIDEKKINVSEAVIIAGDLNVDSYGKPAQYDRMLQILGADSPTRSGHKFSFDPSINDLASSALPEMLDYVLVSNRHKKPASNVNRVLLFRSSEGWKEFATEETRYDLSDHFAVQGQIEFSQGMQMLPPGSHTVITPPVKMEDINSGNPVSDTNTAAVEEAPCVVYARESVLQNQQNFALGCGYSGPVWDSDYPHHYDWCKQGTNATYIEDALLNRQKALSECSGKKMVKEGGSTLPGASTGQNNSSFTNKIEFCNHYAQKAVDQYAFALKHQLSGIVPPVWSGDPKGHYNWCMGAPEIQVIKGEALRDQHLENSLAPNTPGLAELINR